MKRGVFLLVSVLLHAVVWLWLYALDSEPDPPEAAPVEITLRERAAADRSTRPVQKRTGLVEGKSRGGGGLRAFVPKADGMFRSPGKAYYEKIYAEAKGSSEWNEEDFGSHGTDLLQYAEHLGDLDELRQEIENILFYPGVLARRNIQGVINARMYFNKGSRCAFKRTRVHGAQPYLRVYILAVIDKVCKLSFVERMGFREGQTVDLSFNFYISEHRVTREMDERMSRINGNVLTFQRGFTESSLEWELGPIRGTWFAPMVFLNIPWIAENWETYVDKKDPLRDFR